MKSQLFTRAQALTWRPARPAATAPRPPRRLGRFARFCCLLLTVALSPLLLLAFLLLGERPKPHSR